MSHFLLTGTHAYLSPKHVDFEEKVYNVPVIINDNGKPPLEMKVNLEGMLCTELFISRQVTFMNNQTGLLNFSLTSWHFFLQ